MELDDQHTYEYLLQLMRDVPVELAKETGKLRIDVQCLAEQITMLERRVQDLCNTVQKVVSIGPLMNALREDEKEIVP